MTNASTVKAILQKIEHMWVRAAASHTFHCNLNKESLSDIDQNALSNILLLRH